MSIEKMTASADEILKLARGLVELTARSEPPSAELLAEARWNFARYSMLHLQLKEKLVYGPLEDCTDPKIAATVRHFREGQEALHERFVIHMQKWDGEAALYDWKGFGKAVKEIVDVLVERAAYERRDLFPLVWQRNTIEAVTPRVARNWNRDIWTIKAAIERH